MEIGVAAGIGRTEGVAVERVVRAGAGLGTDRLRQLRAQRALREDRLDALPADQVGEIAQVLGVRLRLRRLRGNDGADDLDPVALGEVIEGVVIGAGVIGLAAARALALVGIEVLVLEQACTIGF